MERIAEDSGCWNAPPQPAKKMKVIIVPKLFAALRPKKPKPAKTVPATKSGLVPARSDQIPTGIWNAAVAVLCTARKRPTWANERPNASRNNGNRA